MGIKESKDKMTVELDWGFIKEMALRMDQNKHKYPRGNWKENIDKVELEDALMRHWFAYQENKTDENHLAAIALNAMMIWVQTQSLNPTPNYAQPVPKGVMVDPPSGWQYGFPKVAPYPLPDNMIEWVVDSGYPRKLIEELGEQFYIQYSEIY